MTKPKRRRSDVSPVVQRVVSVPVPGDVFDPEDEDISEEQIETEEKFSQFRSEVGDDEGYAYIYLKDVKGRLQYLDRLGKDQVALPEIAALFGGGRYVVRLFRGDGSRYGSHTISIDPRVKPRVVESAPTSPLGAAPVGMTASEIEMRIKMATLEGKLEGLQGNGGGGIGQLKDIVGVLAPLMAPQQRGGGGVGEMVTGLREVLALSKDLGGGGGEDRGESGFPWKTLLDRVEPLVTIAVEQAQAQKGVIVTPAPVAPAALKPGEPNPPPTTTETVTVPLWQRMVGTEIPKLVDLATKDKDPELWADVYIESLEEKLPVTFFDQIAALAKTPNAVEEAYTKAVALWPQIAPHETWMRAFLTALVEQLTEEEEPPKPGNDVTAVAH